MWLSRRRSDVTGRSADDVLGQKFRSAACETRFAAASKQVVQLRFGLRYQKRRTLWKIRADNDATN